MDRTASILGAVAINWILSAVACATLPMLRAIPDFGSLGAMGIVLALGLAVAAAAMVVIRKVLDIGRPTKVSWGSFAVGPAAILGVITFGLPLGLIWTLERFLSAPPSLGLLVTFAIWIVCGVWFGLVMRWLALRQGATG